MLDIQLELVNSYNIVENLEYCSFLYLNKNSSNSFSIFLAWITSKPTEFINCEGNIQSYALNYIHKTPYNTCIFSWVITLPSFFIILELGPKGFYTLLCSAVWIYLHILYIMWLTQIVATTSICNFDTRYCIHLSKILNIELRR